MWSKHRAKRRHGPALVCAWSRARLARVLLAYAAAVAITAVFFASLGVVVRATEPLRAHTPHAFLILAVEEFGFFFVVTAALAALPFLVAEIVLRMAGRQALGFHALAGAATGACMTPLFLSMKPWEAASSFSVALTALMSIAPGAASGLAFGLAERWLEREPRSNRSLARPSRWLLAASLATAALAVHEQAAGNPMTHPPRALAVAIGGTVKNLMARNAIPDRPREDEVAYSLDLDRLQDWSPLIFEGWIAVTIEVGTASVSLPPATDVWLSQTAGRIHDVSAHVGPGRQTFREVVETGEAIVAAMQAKGWQIEGTVDRLSEPTDLTEPGHWAAVANLRSRELVAQITVRDSGDVTAPKSSDRRDFSLAVYVGDESSSGYGESIYPRRLFVFGDIHQELPLRAWVDDPDWMPQSHGMVRRAPNVGESSEWITPPRPRER